MKLKVIRYSLTRCWCLQAKAISDQGSAQLLVPAALALQHRADLPVGLWTKVVERELGRLKEAVKTKFGKPEEDISAFKTYACAIDLSIDEAAKHENGDRAERFSAVQLGYFVIFVKSA